MCPLLRTPVLKELPLLSGRDRRPILGVSESPQRPPWQRAHLIQRASQVRAARSHYGEKTMGLGEAVTPPPGFASSLLLPHSGELTQQQLYGVGAQPVPGQRWALEPSLAIFLGGPNSTPALYFSREKILRRKTQPLSFYLDMGWLANYWGCDGEPRR